MRKSVWAIALSWLASIVSWHTVEVISIRVREVARYVVCKAAAVHVGLSEPAEWKLVERLYSFRVRTMLGVNMLNGRHPGMIDMRMLS